MKIKIILTIENMYKSIENNIYFYFCNIGLEEKSTLLNNNNRKILLTSKMMDVFFCWLFYL